MGSIPLPALDVKAPQQPDVMGNYANLMRLRAMQQEAANAPLQRQALQQQVQSGGLQVQQQQQALTDQRAMTTAMQQWDGKDISALPPLVLKNGGSANAVMSLKQKSMEMQSQYSTIAKNDAEAGTANMATMLKKNDMISGALETVLQTPDAQLPQALSSTAQDLVQRGVLDPQHAQAAAQIAQSGNPTQIRQQLEVLRKSYMGQSQLMDEAQKSASIASTQANTAKTTAETNYYAQNGGAPGVSAEMMQQSDWLKKNPTKGPADYKLFILQHTPTAAVMGNQFSPGAVDLAAQNLLTTGQGPAGMYRSPGTIAGVYNKAAEMNAQQGGSGIAANKATFQANEGSLKNLTKQFDTVNAFESTAGKNIDMALQKAAAVPDLGTRFMNTPIRMINEKMLGTREMAEFRAALATAQTESAKVLNSANASGVLSDSARNELENITSGNLSLNAMKGQWGVIKQDMQNRHDSYQQQIADIQGRIKGAGAAPAANAPAAPQEGTVKTNGAGDKVVFKGGKWQIQP